MYWHSDHSDRIWLITFTQLGQNCVAGDGHSARVCTLSDSVSMVCARVGRNGSNFECRTHEFSGGNFVGQADSRIDEEAFRLDSQRATKKYIRHKTLSERFGAF